MEALEPDDDPPPIHTLSSAPDGSRLGLWGGRTTSPPVGGGAGVPHPTPPPPPAPAPPLASTFPPGRMGGLGGAGGLGGGGALLSPSALALPLAAAPVVNPQPCTISPKP